MDVGDYELPNLPRGKFVGEIQYLKQFQART